MWSDQLFDVVIIRIAAIPLWSGSQPLARITSSVLRGCLSYTQVDAQCLGRKGLTWVPREQVWVGPREACSVGRGEARRHWGWAPLHPDTHPRSPLLTVPHSSKVAAVPLSSPPFHQESSSSPPPTHTHTHLRMFL